MAETLGEAVVRISGDDREYNRTVAGLKGRSEGIFCALGGIGKTALLGAGAGLLGLGGALGVVGFGFNNLKQQAQLAFETMLGSGEKAKTFLDDLQKFAATTPFEFPELIRASQKLLAFGFQADQVRPVLTAVGDAVAGMGGDPQIMEATIRSIGQVRAKGRLMAEEMMQFAEAGTFSWTALAKQLGVSVPDAMEEVRKGAVTTDRFLTAFVAHSQQNFGGLMEKQSHTFGGLLSTIKDTFSQVSGTVMAPFFKMATGGMQKLVDLTSSPEFMAGVQRFAETLANGLSIIAGFLAGLIAEDGLLNRFVTMLALGLGVPKGSEDLIGFWSTLRAAVRQALHDLRNFWEDIQGPAEDAARILREKVLPALQDTLGWLIDHKELIGAAALAWGVFVATTQTFAAIQGLQVMFATLKAGILATNTSLLAPPGIAVLLAAIAAAIFLIWQNWDSIWPRLQQGWDFMKDAAGKVKDVVVGAFTQVRDFIFGAFNSVRDFFADNWPKILLLILAPWLAALLAIIGNWDQIWGGIKAIAQAGWNFVLGLFAFAKDAISWYLATYKAVVVGGLEAIVGYLADHWREALIIGLTGPFGVAFLLFIKFKDDIVGTLSDLALKALEIGKDIPGKIWEGLSSMAGWLLEQARGFVDSLIDLLNPKNWKMGSTMQETYDKVGREAGISMMRGLADAFAHIDQLVGLLGAPLAMLNEWGQRWFSGRRVGNYIGTGSPYEWSNWSGEDVGRLIPGAPPAPLAGTRISVLGPLHVHAQGPDAEEFFRNLGALLT